jgi:antitoxin VapB
MVSTTIRRSLISKTLDKITRYFFRSAIYFCHIQTGWKMAITTIFTNNRTQAVRLPAELRLPETVKKVDVRARGNERIISPLGQTWDSFFLNGPSVSEDFMSKRASQEQPDREPL